MQSKDVCLTNEILKKKFNNNFELANYAIKKAQAMVGKEPIVLSDILDDILDESEAANE